MPPTRQEIALAASAVSARAARVRRFERYVDEIVQHPDALSATAEERLAQVLRTLGWYVALDL